MLCAFGSRPCQQSRARACDSRRRFERLLLEHLRALRDRGQRLRDLAQRVERGVELRGLARDRRENARVLDRDAGHRAELLQRGRILLVEPGGRVTAQADGAEHAVPAADWSEELIHRARGGAGRDPAEHPILSRRVAANDDLALAHSLHRAFDRCSPALPVDEDEGVVGLEQGDAAGVKAHDPADAIEHEGEDLLHCLAGRLGHELVHERVALGLPLAQGDRVGARQQGTGAADQRHAETPVIVGEAARLVAEEHEAAHAIADRHRQSEQAVDGQLVGHVVHELCKARLVGADELFGRVDGSQQRPCVRCTARHRLRVQPAQTNPGWLGHVLLAIGGHEVVACERRTELLREPRRQRRGVAGLRDAFSVLGCRHEGAVLLLQLRLHIGQRVVVAF